MNELQSSSAKFIYRRGSFSKIHKRDTQVDGHRRYITQTLIHFQYVVVDDENDLHEYSIIFFYKCDLRVSLVQYADALSDQENAAFGNWWRIECWIRKQAK